MVVERFSLPGTAAAGQGGGIYAANSTLTLTGCQFTGDTAVGGAGGGVGQGGALYVDPSVVAVVSCTFTGNAATAGADLYNLASSITIAGGSIAGVVNNGGSVASIDDLLARVAGLNLNS